MVFTVTSVAIAHGASILSCIVHLLSHNACKALVSLLIFQLTSCFSCTFYSFYCIVLLTTLFVSSCYWQPFPIDNPLITPWSESITTFAEAINASLPSNYTTPLPTAMRAVDRCWCDFSGGFFEPFNISHWEFLSVQKVSQELQRQQRLDEIAAGKKFTSEQKVQQQSIPDGVHGPSPGSERNSLPSRNYFWALFQPFPRRMQKRNEEYLLAEEPASAVIAQHPNAVVPLEKASRSSILATNLTQLSTSSDSSIPMRTSPLEYDLRPYGFGIIVDLGWSR